MCHGDRGLLMPAGVRMGISTLHKLRGRASDDALSDAEMADRLSTSFRWAEYLPPFFPNFGSAVPIDSIIFPVPATAVPVSSGFKLFGPEDRHA